MKCEEIRREALALAIEDRAQLAEQLLSSLEVVSEAEVSAVWLVEAARRAGEIDRGEVELVAGEAIEAQVQSLFK